MPRFTTEIRCVPQDGGGNRADSASREERRLKPMAPIRSYTVILFGLLIFAVTAVIFLLAYHSN